MNTECSDKGKETPPMHRRGASVVLASNSGLWTAFLCGGVNTTLGILK
jgi:hypothetical protein